MPVRSRDQEFRVLVFGIVKPAAISQTSAGNRPSGTRIEAAGNTMLITDSSAIAVTISPKQHTQRAGQQRNQSAVELRS